MKIELAIDKRLDDKTGKAILRFTPVFTANCTATGTLHFASFEAWESDPPKTIEAIKSDAIVNAKIVLREIAQHI